MQGGNSTRLPGAKMASLESVNGLKSVVGCGNIFRRVIYILHHTRLHSLLHLFNLWLGLYPGIVNNDRWTTHLQYRNDGSWCGTSFTSHFSSNAVIPGIKTCALCTARRKQWQSWNIDSRLLPAAARNSGLCPVGRNRSKVWTVQDVSGSWDILEIRSLCFSLAFSFVELHRRIPPW